MPSKAKQKKQRTASEAIGFWMRKIERGESVKDGGGIYEELKAIYKLGEGNWRKGFELIGRLDYGGLMKRRTPEEEERYLEENPEFAIFGELSKSGKTPLQMLSSLRPENPVHLALIEIIRQEWHKSLPVEEANEQAKKIRQKALLKSAMQFRSDMLDSLDHQNWLVAHDAPRGWKAWEHMEGETEENKQKVEFYCNPNVTLEEAAKKVFRSAGTYGNDITKLRKKHREARIPYRHPTNGVRKR